MTKISAVVFDMDGVLIDATEWHYEALNRALALVGLSISRFDHLSTYDGLPTRRKLEMLTIEHGLPAKLHPFLNEMKQRYTMEIVNAQCKPVFQHEYCLSNLRTDGYLLAVASNSVRQSVEIMMERSNLAPYLEFVLSNEDVSKSKPDPEMYTTAIERLGVSPDTTLVVEDNDHGIEAARAAGAHTMVVSNTLDVTLEAVRSAIARLESQVSR